MLVKYCLGIVYSVGGKIIREDSILFFDIFVRMNYVVILFLIILL